MFQLKSRLSRASCLNLSVVCPHNRCVVAKRMEVEQVVSSQTISHVLSDWRFVDSSSLSQHWQWKSNSQVQVLSGIVHVNHILSLLVLKHVVRCTLIVVCSSHCGQQIPGMGLMSCMLTEGLVWVDS